MKASYTCDLHMHTYYSDGHASPAELVEHAARIGLETISITDHDNANGAREALPLATRLNIELIPGIELTSRWDRADFPRGEANVDMLGYFVDFDDAGFQEIERTMRADLEERITDGCAHLTAAGYPLTLEDVYAENPRYPSTLHTILAMIRKGYAKDWDEAVALFDREWLKVRLSGLTTFQVIEAIHAAGGVAILAHPAVIKCEEELLQTAHIKELVDAGLDGLEVYHHRLDDRAQAHFLHLARQFNLVISGGSDEHGWRVPFARMGRQPVTPKIVEAIRVRSARYP